MPIIGRLARIEAGESYDGTGLGADRQARDEISQMLDLRFIVIPAEYAAGPGADYILRVFEGCLETLPGDSAAEGYRVLRPCP
jgi:hypothetical protein